MPNENNPCCKDCLASKHALKGKMKEKFGGICGLVCDCHWTKPNPTTEGDWEKRIKDQCIFLLENKDVGRIDYSEALIAGLISIVSALLHSEREKAYQKGWDDNLEDQLKEMDRTALGIKKQVNEARQAGIKQAVEALRMEKGGDKVISGNHGPIFDWGCSSGYDLAVDELNNRIEKLTK